MHVDIHTIVWMVTLEVCWDYIDFSAFLWKRWLRPFLQWNALWALYHSYFLSICWWEVYGRGLLLLVWGFLSKIDDTSSSHSMAGIWMLLYMPSDASVCGLALLRYGHCSPALCGSLFGTLCCIVCGTTSKCSSECGTVWHCITMWQCVHDSLTQIWGLHSSQLEIRGRATVTKRCNWCFDTSATLKSQISHQQQQQEQDREVELSNLSARE